MYEDFVSWRDNLPVWDNTKYIERIVGGVNGFETLNSKSWFFQCDNKDIDPDVNNRLEEAAIKRRVEIGKMDSESWLKLVSSN